MLNLSRVNSELYLRGLEAMINWAERNDYAYKLAVCPQEGLGIDLELTDALGKAWVFCAPWDKSKNEGHGIESDDEWVDRMERKLVKAVRATREYRTQRYVNGLSKAA